MRLGSTAQAYKTLRISSVLRQEGYLHVHTRTRMTLVMIMAIAVIVAVAVAVALGLEGSAGAELHHALVGQPVHPAHVEHL